MIRLSLLQFRGQATTAAVALAVIAVILAATSPRLSGPRRDPGTLPAGAEVIEESHTDKQSTLLVRTDQPVHDPSWTVMPVSMEDLVLGYMSRARDDRMRRLEVVS